MIDTSSDNILTPRHHNCNVHQCTTRAANGRRGGRYAGRGEGGAIQRKGDIEIRLGEDDEKGGIEEVGGLNVSRQ